MREIILDTEATGLDYRSGHRLVEIGCVELVDKMKTGVLYHQYINPEREMPHEAFEVHGLSGEVLRSQPVFGEIYQDFLSFVKDSPIVIHNARFDLDFINEELRRIGPYQLSIKQTIDTLRMARAFFPGSPVNIDALCRRFGLNRSSRVKHGALIDAKLLAEIYIELSGGRQIGLSFLEQQPQKGWRNRQDGPCVLLDPRANIRQASDFERKYHVEFLGKIKDPLWLVSDE